MPTLRIGKRQTLGVLAAMTFLASTPLFTATTASAQGRLALTAPLPTTVPSGTQLLVADQDEVLQTLFSASGIGRSSKAQVRFGNFHDGPEILEAFRAGAADVAVVGDAPPIQAQANGDAVLIVGVQRNSDREYQLAAAPGAHINSIKEIKGKRIAYAPGTGREAYTLRAIEKAGLQLSQVKLVNLATSDFTDAVRSDRVDLAPLKEPNLTQYLSAYQSRGGHVLKNVDGASTGLRYLYARRAALEDPAKAAALREFVGNWTQAWVWANNHGDAWVDAYFVKNQGLKPEDGRKIYEVNGPTSFPRINQELFATQQHTADLLFRAGSIKKKVNAKLEFDPRFDQVIQAAAPSAH